MKKIYAGFILTALFSFFVNTAHADTTLVYTAGMQTVVIPACVFSIDIDIAGAEGGGNGSIGAPGGLGGRVQATMAVTPGQTLYIFVGGMGDPVGTAGYNGGGLGAGGSFSTPGSGGGGASDIRINGTALTDRIIVAGGGGGGTENGGSSAGGHGGGLIGADGSVGGNPWGCTPMILATGGTQSAGGVGGTSVSCAWNGTDGTFGVGGNAYPVYRCAGGGGGWYGGGGAHNGCSGAGGSSYTEPSMTNVTHIQGYQAGNGIVIINYIIGPPAPGVITGSGSLCTGAGENYSIVPVPGATSYTWSVPAGMTINSGQGTTSISTTAGSTSGNISVYATDACGNSAPTILSVTILPSPIVYGNATDSTVCMGGTTTVFGNGATNYSWSGGATDGIPFVPSTSTTYTVIGYAANGCTDTSTLLITVAPLPTVSLGSDITQCGGGAILDAGNAGSTYVWNDSSTNQTLILSSSGTYHVEVTDPLGCIGADTIAIVIHTSPTVVASAASNLVCLDDD
ncbi:MAG TPA: glycine-rich protein, partial [Bacteroidia bacterium]|nr:glycine-rich protein [Bacteroidia bacterium]